MNGEKNISSTLFLHNLKDHGYSDEHIFAAYVTADRENAGMLL